MASQGASHRHRLSVYALVDNWCTDRKGSTDHQGIKWFVDKEAAGHVGRNQ